MSRDAMTRDAEAGLTLVEMMVALSVIGVMAGLAVISLGAADRRLHAETEARRLATLLDEAADTALLSSRALTFRWDERSYGLGAGAADEAPYRLPDGIVLRGGPDGGAMAIAAAGAGAAAAWTVARGTEEWSVTFDGLSTEIAPAR